MTRSHWRSSSWTISLLFLIYIHSLQAVIPSPSSLNLDGKKNAYEFLQHALFQYSRPDSSEDNTIQPTSIPTLAPSDLYRIPTFSPTFEPTTFPTESQSETPTFQATVVPTYSPTESPTESPTDSPTEAPFQDLTLFPTVSPTYSPTDSPSDSPTEVPSFSPTYSPTELPTEAPSLEPTLAPTYIPSFSPSFFPSSYPTRLGKEGEDWWYAVLGDVNVVASSKISKSDCSSFLQSYFSAEFPQALKVAVQSVNTQSQHSLGPFLPLTSLRSEAMKSVYSLEIWTNSKSYAIETFNGLESLQDNSSALLLALQGEFPSVTGTTVDSLQFSSTTLSPVSDDSSFSSLWFARPWVFVVFVLILVVPLLLCIFCLRRKSEQSYSKNMMTHLCNYYCNDCQLCFQMNYQRILSRFDEDDYDNVDIDNRMNRNPLFSSSKQFPDHQLSVHYRDERSSNYLNDSDDEIEMSFRR